MIFFDCNSTTPLLSDVKTEMFNIASYSIPMNPSSIHGLGRKTRAIMEDARYKIAKSLSIDLERGKYKMIFCSSGTEANNLVIHNFRNKKIFISATEHQSILLLSNYFDNIEIIPVDSEGLIDLNFLEYNLKSTNPEKEILVSVMFANNETGLIQPIQKISLLCKKYGAYFHTDAVQAFGKINLQINDIDPEFITISAHKIGGPVGAAALICKENFHINPLIIGGGQEKGARAGTENVIAISGFAKAAEYASKNLNSYIEKTKFLRDYIEDSISKYFNDVIFFCKKQERLSNTSMIYMKNVSAENQVIQFDLNNICVSSGSACSSGKASISHVLLAMNVPRDIAFSSVRVSVGIENTRDDADKFINIWKKIYNKYNGNNI